MARQGLRHAWRACLRLLHRAAQRGKQRRDCSKTVHNHFINKTQRYHDENAADHDFLFFLVLFPSHTAYTPEIFAQGVPSAAWVAHIPQARTSENQSQTYQLQGTKGAWGPPPRSSRQLMSDRID